MGSEFFVKKVAASIQNRRRLNIDSGSDGSYFICDPSSSYGKGPEWERQLPDPQKGIKNGP